MGAFDIPEGGKWHRWRICAGIEIVCWETHTASFWEACDNVTVERNGLTYARIEMPRKNNERKLAEGKIRDLVALLEQAFRAGADAKLRRIKKELEL